MLLPFLALAPLASSVAAQTWAPTTAACPPGLEIVRPAGSVLFQNQTLNPEEVAYVAERRNTTGRAAFAAYYKTVKAAFPVDSNQKLPQYVETILTSKLDARRPRLAIAASGGGYRAAFYTAGGLAALDSREASSVAAGTGGLLQAADRLTGLSGGSWMASSLAQADFPDLRTLTKGWLAEITLLQPGANTQALWTDIMNKMALKVRAGFKVTFGDFWALALARHFVRGTTTENFFDGSAHGTDVTFSSVLELPTFQSFVQPLPILLTNTRSKGQDDSTKLPGSTTPLSNTVYEISPIEMGSWDASLSAFTPTKYLGTNVKNGAVVDSAKCVTGYDTSAYVTGTSSNIYISYNITSEIFYAGPVGPAISLINSTFGKFQPEESLDVSPYPNPFVGLGHDVNGGYLDTDETELQLYDGGFDGAVTPYQPLLVPAREVDVIIGLDANADTDDNFAMGKSIMATQARADLFKGAYPFPKVPKSLSTFTNTGLANRPVFFGCNDPSTPLVVMIGNSPPIDGSVPVTNTTTAQLEYSQTEVTAFLDQTFTTVTRGFPSTAGATSDPLWSACLACAVTDRARARMGRARAKVCVPCFERYCWDGKEA